MRSTSARLARPLLLAALLSSGATVAWAQEGPAAGSETAAIALDQEERARYVGVYEAETPDGILLIHVYEGDDRLMARPDHEDEPSGLIPLGEHRFRPVMASEAVITFALENGRASQFTIVFPDERGALTAHRRP